MTDTGGTDAAGAGAGAGDLSAELLLRPGKVVNAFEETVQRLLQTIRLGLIGPGGRLPAERELAAMLSVSRDTLRDAIGALADAGYVVSRRGRYGGTFVVDELPSGVPVVRAGAGAGAAGSAGAGGAAGAVGAAASGDASVDERPAVTQAEIEDTLVLRSILEVGAARQAATGELTGVERERLWQALEDSGAATGDDYRRLDSRLHLLIAELVGSPSLVPLIADVRMRTNDLLDRIPLIPANIAHSNEQHENIVKAILRGHPDAAAQAMSEHIAGSEALLRGFLG